jgi:hypothetical protein
LIFVSIFIKIKRKREFINLIKRGLSPPKGYFCPQPHFPPLTAPHVSKPQLFPAVHFPPQLVHDVIFGCVSVWFVEIALTKATPPISNTAKIIPAINKLFILVSSNLIKIHKEYFIIFTLEKLVSESKQQ